MEFDKSRLVHMMNALSAEAKDEKLVSVVLDRCKLSRKDIEQATNICTPRTEAQFINEACNALGDITFAAKAGLSFRTSTGIVAYISQYSKDVGTGFENIAKLLVLSDPTTNLVLNVSSNFASVESHLVDESFAQFHRLIEFKVFGILSRMRAITQKNFYPIEIRFEHQVGKSESIFQKIAGFPVVFGTEQSEIVLPVTTLRFPIPTYNPRLNEHLRAYAEKLVMERKESNQMLRSRVEGVLTSALPGKIMSSDEVATSLGMSARTFARRLKDDGVSYREIVDSLRCNLAKTFMKDDMPLAGIAYSLGYADQAAFSTAFKRWTGIAPSGFRHQA
ncbi:helix-turn-helix domain-containing protein [Falsihalocynthiibacter sp. BN13B15]|uniref:helix-turn-helix domain-containing protein n=1 Tax=Falsihalocynthiibacter sp. BN13B15 TaxID=3240871 RepID=UPI0035109C28